jgi:hypothetical protein
MHSDTINELAAALAKAQGQMRAASKDAKNPHLGNTYATLSSIIEAAKEPLSANGLAFSQILSQGDGGLVLETILMHASGQWLQSEVLVTAQAGNRGVNEVQQLGSSLTYYKRYALTAILGISISEEDDDGNAASQPVRKQQPRQEKPAEPAPPAKQEQAKPNGNGYKQADTTTLFWRTAREMELTKEKAQAILAAAGNDFAVALDRLTGNSQPPAEV